MRTLIGRLCVLTSGVSLISCARATQIPPNQPSQATSSHTFVEPDVRGAPLKWRFDVPLSSTNNTNNFIFDGVSSLLQQWGNTRYRNGHNIVPAKIPVGTLLYHGAWSGEPVVPSTPEWVAMDPEHSFLFCREVVEGKGCWMLTLAVTRPLNILYFDGSSAALMYGCMDTQDLIVWGEVRDERIFMEYGRSEVLCEWGKEYGLDGFLRMQPDFEMMLCDFTDGVEVVSFSNLVPAWPFFADPIPPPREGPLPLIVHRAIESGKWHDHFPGETRIQLDLSRIISFYDHDLFPSLKHLHGVQERWEHRAANVSKEDTARFIKKLDQVLLSKEGGNGVNWLSVYRVIIHRYAERLEVLRYMLNSTVSYTPGHVLEEDLWGVHEYLTTVIFPYILHGVRPPSQESNQNSAFPLVWASPILEKCATTHTHGISKSPGLTYSERILLRAVDDVLYEICRVMVGLWADGVEVGLEKSEEVTEPFRLNEIAGRWREGIVRLMDWLDWSVWVKCDPACGFEEVCYLPTWPWLRRGMIPSPPLPGGPGKNISSWNIGMMDFDKKGDESYWKQPRPSCLRRIQPLETPP